MIYIQKDKFYILSKPLGEGYDVSPVGSYDDFQAGKIILLNEAQAAFKVANPNATTEEVFKMSLNPSPVLSLEQIKAQKHAEILKKKAFLISTDYVGLKKFEGYEVDEGVIQQRKEARAAINQLEIEIREFEQEIIEMTAEQEARGEKITIEIV